MFLPHTTGVGRAAAELWNIQDIKIPHSYVMKFQKTVNGVWKFGDLWRVTIGLMLTKIGFTNSMAGDEGTFIKLQTPDTIYVGVYVDEIIIMSSLVKEAQSVFDKITSAFKLPGELTETSFTFLETEVHRPSPGVLYLSNPLQIEKLADEFGFSRKQLSRDYSIAGVVNKKPKDKDPDVFPKTPFKPGVTFHSKVSRENAVHVAKFQSYVESLKYICNSSRPDIAYAVVMLVKTPKPTNEHIELAKRVVRYLVLSADHKLKFDAEAPSSLALTAFADASHAVQHEFDPKIMGPDTIVSNDVLHNVYGSLIMVGRCPIIWRSMRHHYVVEHTRDAEAIAAAVTAERIRKTRTLLTEIDMQQEDATVIYEDNE